MLEKYLSELPHFLDFPIYLYHKVTTAKNTYEVDKITFENETFKRNKYLINEQQCSCMSWMKTENCKHLRWLQGDFGMLAGCPITYALEETANIIERGRKVFPVSHKKWWLSLENMDEHVNAIVLRFSEPLDLSFFLSIKTFETAQLAVTFIYDPFSEI